MKHGGLAIWACLVLLTGCGKAAVAPSVTLQPVTTSDSRMSQLDAQALYDSISDEPLIADYVASTETAESNSESLQATSVQEKYQDGIVCRKSAIVGDEPRFSYQCFKRVSGVDEAALFTSLASDELRIGFSYGGSPLTDLVVFEKSENKPGLFCRKIRPVGPVEAAQYSCYQAI